MSLSLNLESIILLLFFIAPGFLFTRIYTAYRPRYYREPNTFVQFVLSIVGSTVIHAIILSGVALGLLGYWLLSGMPMEAYTFFDPTVPSGSYPLPIMALTIFGSVIYLGLSLMLARRLATFLGGRSGVEQPRWLQIIGGEAPPEPTLLWHTVLQIEPLQLDLIPPHLKIQLRSGEYFEGDLHRMRLVGDEENTVELALRNVLYSSDAPDTQEGDEISPADLVLLSNQIVLLKSTDILWVSRDDLPQ